MEICPSDPTGGATDPIGGPTGGDVSFRSHWWYHTSSDPTGGPTCPSDSTGGPRRPSDPTDGPTCPSGADGDTTSPAASPRNGHQDGTRPACPVPPMPPVTSACPSCPQSSTPSPPRRSSPPLSAVPVPAVTPKSSRWTPTPQKVPVPPSLRWGAGSGVRGENLGGLRGGDG